MAEIERFANPTSQDEEVRRFDPSVTVESAVTPPSSWFVDDKFYELDQVDNIHYRTKG